MALTRTLPSAERWEHHLVVTLPGVCEGVSSALLNGGFSRWRCDDPEADTVTLTNLAESPRSPYAGLASYRSRISYRPGRLRRAARRL